MILKSRSKIDGFLSQMVSASWLRRLSVSPCVPTTSPVLPLSPRRCALVVFDTCTATDAVTGVASCPHITLQSASGLQARRIRGFFAGQRSAALFSDWTNKPCRPRPRSLPRRHCHSIAPRTRIERTSIRMLTFITLLQSPGS